MNYWVTTDTHLGHDKMKEYCGRPYNFSEKILKNLSLTIKHDDILIHIGDVCIGNDAYWHEQLSLIPMTKWLVRGNHDRKSNIWYLTHGWSFVGDYFKMYMCDKSILFSHKPIIDIGYDINIHGHFHNNDHRTYEPELVAIKNDKQILLCIEHHYQLFKLETIIKKGI